MNSLPYILLGALLILLWAAEQMSQSQYSKRYIIAIAYFSLFIFIGLRGHLYSDFINYYPLFEDVPQIGLWENKLFSQFIFEPGFLIYTSLIKTICNDYFFWVAVSCAIDLWVLHVTFRRYCSSQVLPLLFFIAFQGLFIEFNLYRNVKALDCFLLSLPYLQQRRMGWYILLNLIGASFHISSIVYLPLYWFIDKQWPAWLRWGGIVFANIIILAQIGVITNILNGIEAMQIAAISEKLTLHTQQSHGSYILSIGHIERTFAIVLFTLLYEPLTRANRANRMFYALMWLYYLSFMMCYEIRVFADRIPILFVAGYWVLYTNVIYIGYYLRQIVAAVAISLAQIKLYLSNDIPPARYDNILFGVESYEKRKSVMLKFLSDQR